MPVKNFDGSKITSYPTDLKINYNNKNTHSELGFVQSKDLENGPILFLILRLSIFIW